MRLDDFDNSFQVGSTKIGIIHRLKSSEIDPNGSAVTFNVNMRWVMVTGIDFEL
jgi:hypothetical protein